MKWWCDSQRDVVSATNEYVAWCKSYCDFREKRLRGKHDEMAEHRFAYLRGSFYRWGWMLATAGDFIWKAPKILAVGDIHVENFGAWRDEEGRLVFGVNDFDEAARLPFTSDLVRLALSARLIPDEKGVNPPGEDMAMNAVIEGYCSRISEAPWPQVLEDGKEDLRNLVLKSEKVVKDFWGELDQDHIARDKIPEEAGDLLAKALPVDCEKPRYISRMKKGLGSRGRPRYAAIADWRGGKIAREVKAAVPSAVLTKTDVVAGPTSRIADLLKTRGVYADPMLVVAPRWTVRRLSPETRKLEWRDLKQSESWARVLASMGAALAGIHLAQEHGKAVERTAGESGFREAVREAVDATSKRLDHDWKCFREAHGNGGLRGGTL